MFCLWNLITTFIKILLIKKPIKYNQGYTSIDFCFTNTMTLLDSYEAVYDFFFFHFLFSPFQSMQCFGLCVVPFLPFASNLIIMIERSCNVFKNEPAWFNFLLLTADFPRHFGSSPLFLWARHDMTNVILFPAFTNPQFFSAFAKIQLRYLFNWISRNPEGLSRDEWEGILFFKHFWGKKKLEMHLKKCVLVLFEFLKIAMKVNFFD